MRVTAIFISALASACAVGVGALVAATPASALTTAYAADEAGNPAGPNNIVLSIPVTAQVGAACGGTTLPNTSVNLGVLNQALPSTQVALAIQCSGAFRMGLVSSNGGLQSAVAAPGGYTNHRDYNVALHIIDNSNADNTSNTCLASSLAAAAGSSTCASNLRGPASTTSPGFLVSTPSTGKASYLLISDAPIGSNTLLSATDYTDTLTITLSAAS